MIAKALVDHPEKVSVDEVDELLPANRCATTITSQRLGCFELLRLLELLCWFATLGSRHLSLL